MDNPICFALDGMTELDALRFIELLEDDIGAFKVGLELFIRKGRLPKTKRPIVLDLKLHDIPETVGRAVIAGGDLGARFMTLHVQQRAALEAAVRAAEPFGMTLLGVTVLTSMVLKDLDELRLHDGNWPNFAMRDRVLQLATHAIDCGLHGLVCSPQEVQLMRMNFVEEEAPFLLVPGIRPVGTETNDQKRTGTPGQAIKDGADLLVVGRPIRDAPDPLAAVRAIRKEINEARL